MSYIRSGSNPEKLYIYGTTDTVYISEGGKPEWSIPLNVFNGLIRKYHRKFHDCPCEYKGAQIEEIWVHENGNELKTEEIDSNLGKSECKTKLSYNGNYVIMWDVTWEYIVLSNIERL